MPSLFSTTTTVQNIMDAVAQDVRQTLSSTDVAFGKNTLLDYVNRTSLEMQRASRWAFLLSPPQRFVTQLGVTNYWLGASAGNVNGQYDTGLNLTDIRTIKPGTVYDRSNNRSLFKVDEGPLLSSLEFPDDTARLGRPEQWRQAPDSPNVMNLFPGPDNQNTYQPQPEPPLLSTVAGGGLGPRIYYVTTTFVDSLGNESTAPLAAKIFIPANFLLRVQPPIEPLIYGSTGVRYDRWNIYASDFDGNSTVRQAANIAIASSFTEPAGGLDPSSSQPPAGNEVEPVDGYIIEFRYYRQRIQLTLTSQILQIPDDYKDIVIAGTNAKASKYLQRSDDAHEFYALYQQGIREIIRDQNLHPRGNDFIKPDSAAIGGFLLDGQAQDLFLN